MNKFFCTKHKSFTLNKYNHFLHRILSEFVQISTKHDIKRVTAVIFWIHETQAHAHDKNLGFAFLESNFESDLVK